MPEKIVCRTCGTVVDLPTAYAVQRAQQPATLRLESNGSERLSVRRLLLTIGYLVAAAGTALFFVLGGNLNHKEALFFWPIDAQGHSDMEFIKDYALAAWIVLVFVVAGGFAAARLSGLIVGAVVGALACAGYCGYMHFQKPLDWGDLIWFYRPIAGAVLLAIAVGLLVSRRWLVLLLFIPASIGLALAGYQFNQYKVPPVHNVDWLPLAAGTLHGLVIGLVARVASWTLNRDRATTLLGAFVGAFAGLLLVDDPRTHELLRSPEFSSVQLPFVSLYAELGCAFVLSIILGVTGKRQTLL